VPLRRTCCGDYGRSALRRAGAATPQTTNRRRQRQSSLPRECRPPLDFAKAASVGHCASTVSPLRHQGSRKPGSGRFPCSSSDPHIGSGVCDPDADRQIPAPSRGRSPTSEQIEISKELPLYFAQPGIRRFWNQPETAQSQPSQTIWMNFRPLGTRLLARQNSKRWPRFIADRTEAILPLLLLTGKTATRDPKCSGNPRPSAVGIPRLRQTIVCLCSLGLPTNDQGNAPLRWSSRRGYSAGVAARLNPTWACHR
jgi:hypothetical protein